MTFDERALRIAFAAGWEMGVCELTVRPESSPGRRRMDAAKMRDWNDMRDEVMAAIRNGDYDKDPRTIDVDAKHDGLIR